VTTPLALNSDELVACVSCGLCLPHCPTYRVTGLEIASPRGRIAAMRAVEAGAVAIDDAFETAMNECVQCRGCEAACPSGVHFGHLIEDTRAALGSGTVLRRGRVRRVAGRLVFGRLIATGWLLRAGSWILLVAQRLRLVPRRFVSQLPVLSARRLRLRHRAGVSTSPAAPEAPEAWLFTGCVMDAWMRDVHLATSDVAATLGVALARPTPGGCCGALALHAGHRDAAKRLAEQTIASMPGEAPVVANAAGCGAAMKEYGRLLGSEAARQFAARVVDVCEWVAARGVPPVEPTGRVVVVQDPCHLRHVQRVHDSVRVLLAGAYDLRESADEGLCCGAGGAYAVQQPDLAESIRARKTDALVAAGAGTTGVIVASANPGCMLQLGAAGFDVRHPIQLLAAALDPVRLAPSPPLSSGER
jgi:glycolate oxidase iron-sulfur subunit